MKKKRITIITLITGLVLIGTAVYLYHQETNDRKRKQTVSNTTTEWNNVNQTQESTVDNDTDVTKSEADMTTEKKQNKKLPDNYEWDEKQWGEPPQIIYDFAENQEKFDFIVSEVDSILSREDGFSTWMENGKIHYDSEYGSQLSNELKKEIDYILNNTKFYDFTKYEEGNWTMEYNQDEDWDKYIYCMTYIPNMTKEEAWDRGYIKVVEDWYFLVTPLA